MILPAGIVPAVGVVDALLPARLFDRPLWVVGMFVAAGLLVLASVIMLWRMWNNLRAQVLRHRGLLCPRCRYPLEQLPARVDRCPECATAHDRRATVALWRSFCRLDPTELPTPSDEDFI